MTIIITPCRGPLWSLCQITLWARGFFFSMWGRRNWALERFRLLLTLWFPANQGVVWKSARAGLEPLSSNLDIRALLFRAWLRGRRALGNPETGVFVIGFREEQRTRTWLTHSNKSLLNALLCERRLLQICEEGKAFCF